MTYYLSLRNGGKVPTNWANQNSKKISDNAVIFPIFFTIATDTLLRSPYQTTAGEIGRGAAAPSHLKDLVSYRLEFTGCKVSQMLYLMHWTNMDLATITSTHEAKFN